MDVELFSSERIACALSGIEFVRQVQCLPKVGSTNDVAKQLGAHGAPEATLVVADEQITGRGRMGRSWYSPPGAAIAMSLLVRPKLSPSRAYRLTMLAGLTAAEAIEHVTRLPIKLKWPNDIVFEKSAAALKLGGILTEASISGEALEFAVIGLGLNVNVDLRARPDLSGATSLMLELGHPVDRLEILRALVERFAARYAVIADDAQLHPDWSARLMTLGRQVAARQGEEMLVGLAESVDESGALLIRAGSSVLRRVDAADVTLRDANLLDN